MKNQDVFIESGASFLVPFLGLILFIKRKNRMINFIGFLVNLCVCTILIYFLIKIFPFVAERFSYFGKKPLCNLKEERAMQFGEFVFPFCYRCTFLIFVSLIVFILCCIFKPKFTWMRMGIAIILVLPCLVDGLVQSMTTYTSLNWIRGFTGSIAGIGMGYIFYSPLVIGKFFESNKPLKEGQK